MFIDKNSIVDNSRFEFDFSFADGSVANKIFFFAFHINSDAFVFTLKTLKTYENYLQLCKVS